jgi:hypothetical protein
LLQSSCTIPDRFLGIASNAIPAWAALWPPDDPDVLAKQMRRFILKMLHHHIAKDVGISGTHIAKDIVTTLPAAGQKGQPACFPNTGDLFGTLNKADPRALQESFAKILR